MYPLGVGGPQREISVACQITQRNASQQHRSRVHESVFCYSQDDGEKVAGSAPPLALMGAINGNIVLRYPRAVYSGVSRAEDRQGSGRQGCDRR